MVFFRFWRLRFLVYLWVLLRHSTDSDFYPVASVVAGRWLEWRAVAVSGDARYCTFYLLSGFGYTYYTLLDA